MENILNSFFEKFQSLCHYSLMARYRRQSLVNYLHHLIEKLISDEKRDTNSVVREVVRRIIDHHIISKKQNGNICLTGKYHDILYIAVKLCYDCKLQDTTVVSSLLNQIYLCERTFERILAGSLFSCTAPYFIIGWKSDFANQEENGNAVIYFLNCANNAQLEYTYGKDNKVVRFIDIPIGSYCKMPCVMISAKMGNPVQLLMFLRYGALISGSQDVDYEESIFDIVLERLRSNAEAKNTFNLVLLLKILLRCTDKIFLEHRDDNLPDVVMQRYLDLIDKRILPPNRCGFMPAELKHLSRLAIRKRLWENYQLPNGIQRLPIPDKLKRYVDILED